MTHSAWHSSAVACAAARVVRMALPMVAAAAAFVIAPDRLNAQRVPPPPPAAAEPQPPAEVKPGPEAPKTKKPVPLEGTMTLARMDEIIRRLDKDVKVATPGTWQFHISERPVIIITDIINDRMRILSPVTKADDVPAELMKRMMQANFDTALDARYAVARGVIWATFIHPLRALHDRQFVSAIGQTVNLTLTFGTTFSSGAMSFGGGDSRDIIRKRLIEELLKKGVPI